MNISAISWQQTMPLRHRVLWPSKPHEYCQVEGDEQASHFGAFMDGVLVCVAAVYIDCDKARLRKFATDPQYQNQGIGSKMLDHIIESLKSSQVRYFWCDARASALGFYKRFGMDACSESFFKDEVAYYKMNVTL
jgi:ribosomal protein S18 acetylase RimI-like enzyme